MTPERWQQIESLVEAALERPAGDRSDYLDQACGDDADLCQQVKALVASHEEAGSFLEVPAGVRLREPASGAKSSGIETQRDSWRPERIGPYRILKTLGEGGMGTVYLAEQTEPIHRRVALKVIRPGVMTPEAVRRFDAERQALARMNHSHIAQAYEAGATEDGQPYFVMEYVPGLAITRYCDQERLTIGQRLDLFLAVCDGVHHLHQKGVIHRDVKPSNVLVAEDRGRPVPKIIDFGIAKALDQPLTDGTVFTGERLIGTPSYVSPEAIRASKGGLDIDTRADVYALGVLLYELLTGELPFETRGGSFLEVARRITEDEAPLASTRLAALADDRRSARAKARRLESAALSRRLQGDLDWIVRKAMEKERSRRYGSPAELAEDVRRHLRHEPVVASPPSAVYRLRKFVRRHRSGVASAALIMLALLGGITARTFEASRANREAARANEETARANREAEAAQRVSDFLVGLFEVSDPDQASAGTMTAREILDLGAEKLMGRELQDQPLVQARLMDTIGSVYRKLGFYEPAAELLQQALEIRRDHLGDQHLAVATSLHNLGNIYAARAEYEQAGALYEHALKIREETLGADHDDVGKSLNNLGLIHKYLGRFEQAQELLRRSVEIRRNVLGPEHPDVAIGLFNLGAVYLDGGSLIEGEKLFRRALAIWRRILGPEHARIAVGLHNLGLIAFKRGDYSEAESLFQEALAIEEKVLGPGHSEVARGLNNLAEVHWKQGRFAIAELELQRAREIWTSVGGLESPDLAHALLGLANLYRDQGRWGEAEPLYLRALTIREPVLAADHPDLLETLESYAAYLRATHRDDEAERLEARADAAGGDTREAMR